MTENLLNTDGFIFNGKFYTNHISIGSFSIYFYAICIVTGMILCCLLAAPMFKRKGENPELILDIMIAVVPSAIVGARLWYVLFDIKTFINAENPFFAIIDIRNGGLAIYGGLLAGAIAIAVVCKIKKIKVIKVFDLAAAVVPLGQVMGRWGNFFNQEVYGREITNPSWQFFPAGVQIGTANSYKWYQALFFYEGTLNLLLFIGLYIFLWKSKNKAYGYATGGYFIGYGVIRGVLEPFRTSDYNLPWFGKNTSVPAMTIISILLVIAGIILIIDTMRRNGVVKIAFVDKFIDKISVWKKEKAADKAEPKNTETRGEADNANSENIGNLRENIKENENKNEKETKDNER